MNIEKVTFFSAGKKITARLCLPEKADKQKCPAVILNHGYSGDQQEYDAMAETLCMDGFITLQFDSRGCGGSEAEKGRMLCSTEWLEDAVNAVSFLAGLPEVDAKRIGYTGCSMGGAVTLYMAAMDKRVKCAVAMAPLGDGLSQLKGNWETNRGKQAFEGFLQELETDAVNTVKGEASRYVSVPYALGMNDRDTQDFFDYRDAHPEMVRDVPLESVMNSLLLNRPDTYCPMIDIPFLIIHGSADTIVPIEQSHKIKSLIPGQCEMITIEGAPHPLPTSEYAQEVFRHASEWFCKYL